MDFLDADLLKSIIVIGVLIFSIIIHEMAHGYAALFLGDNTAERAGRLTLNPIPHLDPVGSILLPVIFILTASPFFFGYAKPVPYNPNNLRNKKWGDALVAFAGPLSNLVLAFIFTFITGVMLYLEIGSEITLSILSSAAFLNIFLAILNLIPIPPLDGSKVFLDILKNFWYELYLKVRRFFEKNTIILLIILFIFIFSTNILITASNWIWNLYLNILSFLF